MTEIDNKTVAKLVLTIARAIQLQSEGEVIGPLTRKAPETFDTPFAASLHRLQTATRALWMV